MQCADANADVVWGKEDREVKKKRFLSNDRNWTWLGNIEHGLVVHIFGMVVEV